jgi:hypothetical protein
MTNQAHKLAPLILAILLFACSDDDEGGSRDAASTPAPLTDEQLRNASYPLEAATQLVTLTDGSFRSSDITPTETQLRDPRGFGYLDAGDSIDAAVVLASQLGGSGTFLELVAVLNEGGEPQAVDSILLGDRVPVSSVEIVDRQIVVRLRLHGPADPLCCPTVEATRTYALSGNVLTLVSEQR